MKAFHPMALLLKAEGYPPAVIASVILHLGLLAFVLGKSVDPADYINIEDPVIITASAIDVNPQRLRRLERVEQERLAQQRRDQERQRAADQQRERERQAELARQRDEAQRRQAEQDRQRAADQQRARDQQAAQAREQEDARRREQQRLAQEQAAREAAIKAAEEAQASQVASENLIVAEYSAKIRQAITQSWKIPPSARNGMSALVRLRLVPTGEVVGITFVQRSGNDIFDRSVEQAVEAAGRFPELQELENSVFERNFRTFDLLFRPEDLQR